MLFRRPLTEERQVLGLWGVAVLAVVLLRPILPRLAEILPDCPFRALTGLPCLSCGTTRAALCLAQGKLAAAFQFNPLAAAALLAFLAGGVVAPFWGLLRWPVPETLPVVSTPLRRAAAITFLLAVWGWQIAHGI